MGEGPAGQIYAMFDNGQIFELQPLYSADFDNDGDVDATDLATLKTAFGTTAAGDADGDGDTDGGDLLLWQQQLGGAPLVAALNTAVPEPAMGVLVARRASGCTGGVR